jgi:tetratricopeptide (TPR) repeat protein
VAATGQPAANGQFPVAPATWTERVIAPFKGSIAAIGLGGSRAPRVTNAPLPEYVPTKESPELFVGMAQMSHRGGNVHQARTLYQKALAMDPNHLDALLGAARMEDREGRLDVALMLYQRAVTAHPNNATAHNDLALCQARRGELIPAHQSLEQAIRLDPRKALYRNNAAKVLVELNQLDQATSHLAAVHPPAIAHYNMGVLLSDRGRDPEASHYLSKALALDPAMEPARELLALKALSAPAGVAEAPPMLVQTTPVIQPTASEPSDSILPTPEVVATIPWHPPTSAELPGRVAAPAFTSGVTSEVAAGDNPVLLLPPVR